MGWSSIAWKSSTGPSSGLESIASKPSSSNLTIGAAGLDPQNSESVGQRDDRNRSGLGQREDREGQPASRAAAERSGPRPRRL